MFTTNRYQKALSDETVRHLRYLYFIEYEKLDTLSANFKVSIPTLKKALHGKRPYQDIEDSIPLDTKQSRKRKGHMQRMRRKNNLQESQYLKNMTEIKARLGGKS